MFRKLLANLFGADGDDVGPKTGYFDVTVDDTVIETVCLEAVTTLGLLNSAGLDWLTEQMKEVGKQYKGEDIPLELRKQSPQVSSSQRRKLRIRSNAFFSEIAVSH